MRIVLLIVGLLAAFFTMPWWLPQRWYRALYYPGGRPRAFTSRLNTAQAWLNSRGVATSLMISLETKGRRTGKILRVPLVPAYIGPNRYLISMLGERADWVLNVKAAGGAAVLRHGTVEQVRLEEVPVSERAPILKEYLRRAPGGRPHFDIGPHASLEQFAAVAARYPVFRVVVSGRPLCNLPLTGES